MPVNFTKIVRGTMAVRRDAWIARKNAVKHGPVLGVKNALRRYSKGETSDSI